MMKLIMPLIFMIPLCFFLHYWLFLLFLLLLSFVILISTSGSISHLFINLSYFCGIDLLSLMLILLSLWICSLMIIASEKIYKLKNYSQFFVFMNLILLLALVLTFSSLNFFMFYLFFEISLIPTLFLIIGWGYQPERISAGVYLLFYTLMVSLPMMVAIFYLYKTLYSLEFYFFYSINSLMLYYCINMVFLVKIPMFFLHLWLPKAHVEAPISGSMILAGVMLKLGGYGLLRTMALFSKIGMKLNMYIIIISLVGGVIVSLICLRQSDIKSLIAYSSVAHMGLVLSGTLTMNLWGVWGALVMLLAHGLCSSGLFCLANISYERVVSRSIYLNKGMINLMPSVSLWWFLLCSSNMAAPPSLNLLGEILLINSLISYSNWLAILLFLVSFFSAAYSVFLYSYTQHGMIYSGLYSFNQVFYREYLLLFLHWFPLNIIILKSEILTLWV